MDTFRINERNINQNQAATLTTQVQANPVAPMLRTNPKASLASQLLDALGAASGGINAGIQIADRRDEEADRLEKQKAQLAATQADVPTNQADAQAAIPEESSTAWRRTYMFQMGRRNANDYANQLSTVIDKLQPEDDLEGTVQAFTQDYTKGLDDADYLDGFNEIAFRVQEQAVSNAKAKRLAATKEILYENLTADGTQFLELDQSNRPKAWMDDILNKGKSGGIAPLVMEANIWSQAAAMAVKEGRLDILQDPAWTEGRGELASFKDRNRDKYDLAMYQAQQALKERNKTSVSLEAYNFTNAVNFAITQAKEGLEPLPTEELNKRIWGYVSTGVLKQNEGEAMYKSIIEANTKFDRYARLSEHLYAGQPFTESVSQDDFRGVSKLMRKKLAENGQAPEQIDVLMKQMATKQGRIVPEDMDIMARGINDPLGKDGKPSQYTVQAFNTFMKYRQTEHNHLLQNNLDDAEYAYLDKAMTFYNQDPQKNVEAAVSAAAQLVKAEKNPNLEASYNAIKWDDVLSAGLKKVKALGGKNNEATEEYLNSYLRSNGKSLFVGYNGQISSKELGEKLAEKFYGTHVQTPTFWMDATGLPVARDEVAAQGENIEKAIRWQVGKLLENPAWTGGKDKEDVKVILRAAPANIYTGEGGNYEVVIDGKPTRITVDPLQILKKYQYAQSPEGVTEYFAPIEQAIIGSGTYDKAKSQEYTKAINIAHDKGIISTKRKEQLMEMNENNMKTYDSGIFTQNIVQTQRRIQDNPLFKNMMAPTDNLMSTSTVPYTYDQKRMPLKMVREQAATFGRKQELALAGAAAGLGYSGIPYDFGSTKRIGFGYNLSDKDGFTKDWIAAGYASNEKGAEAAYNGLMSGKISLDKERATTLHQQFQKRIGVLGEQFFKDAPPHLQHAGAFAYMALDNPSEKNAKKFFELVAKGDEEKAKAMLGGVKQTLGKDKPSTDKFKSLSGVRVQTDSGSRDRLYELFRTMANNPTIFQRKLESEWNNFK